MRHTTFRLPAAVLVTALAVVPVWAQAPGYPQGGPSQGGFPQATPQPGYSQQDEGDSPDHAVARISVINGEVSVAHDNGDMVAASPNAPMVAGDRILTGENSRAEVQFDGTNQIGRAHV